MSKELGNPFNNLIETTPSTTTTVAPTPESVTPPSAVDKLITNTAATSPPPTAAAAVPFAHINPLDQKINAIIEQVFAITVTRQPLPPSHRPLIYMEEIAPLVTQPLLTLSVLDQALFERLLLNNPADFLIPSDTAAADAAVVVERRVLSYLHGAYVRNARRAGHQQQDSVARDACARIEELIVRNAATAVKQPDLYEGQLFGAQLVEIVRDADVDEEMTGRFVSAVVREVMLEPRDGPEVRNLRVVCGEVFAECRRAAKQASLGTLDAWVLPALMLFAGDRTNADLAMLLVEYNQPAVAVATTAGAAAAPNGAAYMDTLFGDLLRLSILPKQQNGRAEYFQGVINAAEAPHNDALWSVLRHHLDAMHTLFRALLVAGDPVRSALLSWIGACLHANAARGQLWNAHNPMAAQFGSLTTASDAFMLGLAGVMLRLCKPLLRPQLRVLIVDPTYCAVTAEERVRKSVHMIDMDKETALIPPAAAVAAAADAEQADGTPSTTATRETADTYNFVTECFFMTHRALDLGYRVCVEQFFKMNRELRRVQQAYQSAIAQGGQTDTSASLMDMLTSQMPLMMCLSNALLEPTADQLLLQFHEATAIWLAQLAARPHSVRHPERGFAPCTNEPLELPLAAAAPTALASIPEFIVENVVGYLTFIRHFDAQAIDSDPEAQRSLFTMLLVFMGDAERVRNPHLRARMAEGMESLLPQQQMGGGSAFRSDWRRLLFTEHPLRMHCVESVLRVFVGIEMTGQSVQFEQKFNYRRPMYIIMDYLWTIPEQQRCFEQLAERAEREMENVDPPIFLRFVNLLINDAIFLLDESLSNLQQIRTLQQAQDAGEWATLGQQERQQNVANMQHLGTMARFDNILGRDTIRILRMLTSKIGGIFCHAAMRERVAAMLNYFLLHLVGPNKKNFKVKDPKEFEFDPAHTVREICQIYINLQASDEFALAVSQDGRSYSAQLFVFAEQVLVRIGGGLLIGELNEFAQKVHRLEQLERVNQEALADAPDEYLDPIMSTLMLDPVRLPSSNVTVDRTTIARHLLSDQSDPFNRSPLTMDQVRPDVELRTAIEAWMAEKRRAAADAARAKAAAEVTEATAGAEASE